MKKVFTLIAMTLLAAASSFAQDEVWTVAGNANILNGSSSWAPANTENDMTWNAENERYELVVTDCGLEAGSYEYKFVKDHAWTVSYPDGSGNLTLTIPTTGMYTITYYYEPDTGLGDEGDAEAVRTGDYTPSTEVVLTVAGSSVPLFGTSWDPTNTDNDMTLVSGTVYQLVKKNVVLGKGTIQYKVAKDHDWGSAWPSNNASFAIPEDGTYDVTFTFDYSTKAPSAEAVFAGSAQVDHYWTIAGSSIGSDANANLQDPVFGLSWDPTLEDNDMTENADGTWTLVKSGVEVGSNDLFFKACFDHDWSVAWGELADEQGNVGNASISLRPGKYDITFTLILTEGEEQVTARAIPLDGGETAISEVDNDRPATVYYNLQGIQTNRLQRGLYITNGRKVVIK